MTAVLADRFRAASDPKQVKQLGERLAGFVFGEQCPKSSGAEAQSILTLRHD